MRLWVTAYNVHQLLESLLWPRWGRGAQAKAQRRGCLESVNFLLQFSLLPGLERGLTCSAGEPLGLGRVTGRLRDFAGCGAPGVELCWSLSGKGAHCSPQPLRWLLGAQCAAGVLPPRLPGLCVGRASTRTCISADPVRVRAQRISLRPLIEK